MPRKSASHSKKETAVETKTEGGAPRRSGRASTKQETGEKASRSRRSSTAAQTAASVADSKSPKSRNSVSSRRDSTSPSDNRSRTSREGGVECPATRVKSTRRNASRVNYKESDGEEEVAAVPKQDENFDSGEEFEESDSDEKSKPKGKGKATKPPAKSKSPKEKSKGGRGRRGRPIKKKSYDDDDSDTFDVSDNSEEESAPSGRKRGKVSPAKESEPSARSARGRKTKAAAVVSEEKPKASRRSARSASNKEETVSRRPSRSVQAKKYVEDEDDDIEEISDSKPDEEEEDKEKSTGSARKRKRNSASEPSKRLKEDDDMKEEDETEDAEEKAESEKNQGTKNKEEAEDSGEEPMQIDETDANQSEDKPSPKKESDDSKKEIPETKDAGDKKPTDLPVKVKLAASNKQDSVDSFENADSLHSSDSEHESQEHSVSSGLDDSQDTKKKGKMETKSEIDLASQSSESFQQMDENSEESKSFQSSAKGTEQALEKKPERKESSSPQKAGESGAQDFKNDVTKMSESNATKAPVSSSGSLPTNVIHSKESNMDASVNGPERTSVVTNPSRIPHSAPSVISEHKDTPKANGAHENLHNNPTPEKLHFPLPGRKYVYNSKLGEKRQILKEKTFGFLSHNFGSTCEPFAQKEKLVRDLNKLQADVFCLQQVPKMFFTVVLEPYFKEIGFKGIFSQPQGSTNGMATFFRSSIFNVNVTYEFSLKFLVEKELETAALDSSDKAAIKTHLEKCGFVLFTDLVSIIGKEHVTVGNIQIPRSDLSIQALQVACLARQAASVMSSPNKALLLCGEFNMAESEAPYQLLRDGYLSNDMIEELQRRKDVTLPGKENAALINLLWKAFQHPSSDLSSCYRTVLDRELVIPEKKATSPDLVWFSSNSLHALGVLDFIAGKTEDSHISLKVDLAFSV